MASNRRPVGINFEKILQSVQNDVREMKIEFEESGLPITDDNKQLHQFCERLEFILKFGLRERNSVLGGKKDLWQYFCKCLADRRNIRDGLKIVKANTELKTGVGRGRCFLRYCLVHQCMGDVLQQCVDNQSVSRHFYQDGALLTDAKLSPTLLNCLYQLCDVPFDLPPTGHDLDVSWPTFSRHGSAGGAWLPPSRAVSLSSLSSYSSQVSEAVSPQLASPPGMAPVGEDEPSQDCLESPQHNTTLVNMEASLEVTSLHDRLALLEDDNATLRASCASLQHKLDQTQQESDVSPPQHAENTAVSQTPDKCVQCEQLSEELRASRAKCSDLQCLQQRMENQVNELQTQVDNLQTQETYLKNEIVSLEKKLKETVSAGDRLTTGVHALLKETDVTAVPKVTVTPERSPALQPTSVILQPDTDSLPPPQQVLDHYQSKLEILEKENQTLREQCLTAEKEKTALRTNIRKISEAEEQLKQKVASLSQREEDYESLQEEIDALKDKYEERGQLLHIATDRVKELEGTLNKSEATATDALSKLKQANTQITEFQTLHSELDNEHKVLKEEMLMVQQQVADLRFQISSKDIEKETAVKDSLEKAKALTAAATEISEQEARISALQQEAATQKQDLLIQHDNLSSEANELRQNLIERDSHCSDLDERVQQAQNSVAETLLQLTTTREASEQLNDDNAQLREKIIQLLREKDALWQANIRLEGAAGCGRAWMDNSSAQKCLGCNVAFSLTRRRHHCRVCGRIFCTGCSDNWIMTPASSRRVRVCDDCFSVQAELATLIASPAPQSVNNTHDGFVGTSMESGTEVTQTTGLSHPLPIGSQEPDDDDYAIISDDELQSSKLSSSPSSGSPPSASDVITETRATKEILTPDSLCESPPTNAEVWVGAGTRVLVPVDLPVGVILHWNFVSEPKSVSFAVLHQPQVNSHSGSDEEGTASHQRVLIPTTRVASTQGAAVRGRLLTKQPGVYTLVFDNSFSRYTAKKVTYTLRLDNQSNLEGTSPVTTLHPLPTPPEDSLPKP